MQYDFIIVYLSLTVLCLIAGTLIMYHRSPEQNTLFALYNSIAIYFGMDAAAAAAAAVLAVLICPMIRDVTIWRHISLISINTGSFPRLLALFPVFEFARASPSPPCVYKYLLRPALLLAPNGLYFIGPLCSISIIGLYPVYGLPKIHKPNASLRIIVSSINNPLYSFSLYFTFSIFSRK